MQQVKLLFVALMMAISTLGCGGSNSTAANGSGSELTPEQIAEQETVLNAAEASERALKKGR